MKRINYSSGAKWESIIGYSRAVRIGNTIEMTGTTAVDDDGNVVGVGDAYKQTQYLLSKVERFLKDLDAELTDVVRTRMFVTDITKWEEVGRAHGEYFGEIMPATTMVEVSGLIDPDMMVEIEVTAIIGGEIE